MKKRIISVDIFRGLTIALMVLVNTPGTWNHVYSPFLHAEWHGYTPTDLVFPFFLFIVGTSIVFAYSGRTTNLTTYKKIGARTLKLIGLGLFLGAFTLDFPFIKSLEVIRFPGVLQRIGICFFFAAILFLNCNWKTILGICVTILVGYWLFMGYMPLNGMTPTFDRAVYNWANYIDLNVFGTHMWQPDYDPEGLLGSLPAICSGLLGIFTGMILVSYRKNKVRDMLIIGVGVLAIGCLWTLDFPINKALWSSSFVLVTAGWANLLLALIYYLTDVKGVEFGSIFKKVGANAITVYFLSSFISKTMGLIKVNDTNLHDWLFNAVYVYDIIPIKLSSLLYGLTVMAFYMLFAAWLYKKKIFIKI
ncbi:MAG: heparan-alpha-glucosaminide N-acetyltransferase domain-containing protein [Flavobacteriaceae bacterium]